MAFEKKIDFFFDNFFKREIYDIILFLENIFCKMEKPCHKKIIGYNMTLNMAL